VGVVVIRTRTSVGSCFLCIGGIYPGDHRGVVEKTGEGQVVFLA